MTVALFDAVFEQMGTDVLFHREEKGDPCACRTPEGFRDPAFHTANPSYAQCNEQGFLPQVKEFVVKASIQPSNTRFRRMSQFVEEVLGSVEKNDKIGFFPVFWNGNEVDFEGWSEAGEDYIIYDGHRYTAVAADKMGDVDGNPNHHWAVALRRIKNERTGIHNVATLESVEFYDGG